MMFVNHHRQPSREGVSGWGVEDILVLYNEKNRKLGRDLRQTPDVDGGSEVSAVPPHRTVFWRTLGLARQFAKVQSLKSTKGKHKNGSPGRPRGAGRSISHQLSGRDAASVSPSPRP